MEREEDAGRHEGTAISYTGEVRSHPLAEDNGEGHPQLDIANENVSGKRCHGGTRGVYLQLGSAQESVKGENVGGQKGQRSDFLGRTCLQPNLA